jgi:hypothetical protein
MNVQNETIQNLTLNPATLSTKQKTSTCGSKYLKMWRKIFTAFGCGPTLKGKEIRAIKDFKTRSINAFPKNAFQAPAVPPNIRVKHKLSNESLEGVRDFAHALVDLTVKCIQEKYVNIQLKTFNDTAKEFPDTLKNIAKQILSVGAQSLKPIFEMLKNFNLNNEADQQINLGIQWLLKDSKYNETKLTSEDFKKLLKENKVEFKKQLREKMNPSDKAWDASADEIIHWLFLTDHKKDLFEIFKEKNLSQDLINSILNESLLFLIDDKIDVYGEKVGKILGDKLPGIIEKAIKDNALKFTEVLSTRVTEVIEKMGDEFTVLSDKMVEIAGNHFSIVSKSHEMAERAEKEHEALVAYAKEIKSIVLKDSYETETLFLCEEYLNNVKIKGGIKKIKEETLLKTFLALTGNNVPCIDNTISESISRLILETLLPPITNSEGKQISGLENLLSTIELPKEFKDLFDEAASIAKQIISPEQFNQITDLSKIAIEFKDLALEGCAELIKMGMEEAIEIGLKRISKPEELNLLLTNSIPATLESMYKFFGDDLIQANIEHLAPLFQKLPDASIEREILDFLFEKAQKATPVFNLVLEHELAFHKSIKPRINEIAELLNEVKNKDLPNEKYSKPKTTIAILKEFFSSEASEDNNPHFAKFIDAALGTGEFGSFLPKVFKIGFIRNIITRLMTSSAQNFRKSYRPGLNVALPLIADNYLRKEVIESWIDYAPSLESLDEDIVNLDLDITDARQSFSQLVKDESRKELKKKIEETSKTLEEKKDLKKKIILENEQHAKALREAQEKMPGEVHKIARLGYDMIMYKTGQNAPRIIKYMLGKILGSKADKIHRVVLTLFNNIFGRQIFNRHLISRISLTSLIALNKTSTAVGNAKPLLQGNQLDLSRIHTPITFESYNNALKTAPFAVAIKAKQDEKPPLWKRILNFIIKIFKAFFNLFNCKKIGLNARQKELMSSIQKPEVKELSKTDPKNLKETKTPALEPTEFEIDEGEVEKKPEKKEVSQKVEPPLNASLEKVRRFVLDFMQLMSDGIMEEKIKPITDEIKKRAANLPAQLGEILDRLSQATAPLATTILSNIQMKGYKIKLDDTSRAFFNILFKTLKECDEISQTNAIDDLKKFLKESLANKTKLSEPALISHINPIINWISQQYTNTKEIKSLDNYTETDSDPIMANFYIKTVQWLIKFKIQSHVGALQNFLKNNLEELIKSHLNNNMQNLSNLLFYQVGERLNKITDGEYKTFFDESALILHKQMQNLINAEKNAKSDKNTTMTLELAKMELPAKDLTRTLLNPPENVKDIAAYKASEENKAYLEIVKRMFNIVFPKGDGSSRDVDAFAIFWDKIEIDDEVKDAAKDILLLFKALLPSRIAGKVDIYEEKIKKLIKEFALNSVHQYATKLLAEKLKDSFKHLVETRKRQELLITYLPVVNEQLAFASAALLLRCLKPDEQAKVFKLVIEETAENKPLFTKQISKLCLSTFTHSWDSLHLNEKKFSSEVQKRFSLLFFSGPIFKNVGTVLTQLRLLMGNAGNQKALDAICDVVIKTIQETFNWNSPLLKNDLDRTKESKCFKLHIEPLLLDIVSELEEKQRIKQIKEPNAALDDKDISTTLTHYFDGENDNQTLYVDLIADVMQMGEIGGIFNKILVTTLNQFKSTISAIIVPAMHPVRVSLRNVMELTVQGLRALYLNKDYIKSLLNQKSLPALEARKKNISDKIEQLKTQQGHLLGIKDSEDNNNNGIANAVEQANEIDNNILKLKQEQIIVNDQIREEKRILNEKPTKDQVELKFDAQLKIFSSLIFDLIEYSVGSTIWTKICKNPDRFHEIIQAFNKKFFEHDALFEAIMIEITNKALNLIDPPQGKN